MKSPAMIPPGQHNEPADREAALRAEIAELRRQLDESRKHADPLANPQRPSPRRILWYAAAAVAVIAVALTAGLLPKTRRQAEIVAEARVESQSLPVVSVVAVKRADAVSELTLPANIQAVTEAPILARADGYLKRRFVDIGDRVAAGQLLAEVDAPELDQQVQQAKAAVEQQRAAVEQTKAAYDQGRVNEDLARVTAQRWSNLLAKGAVSRQENDQYQAQFQASSANVQALDRARAAAEKNLLASEANYARLLEMQSYKHVRAPFAGVITLRNVDTGALISSGQTLLFRVAQTGMLRAYVNVPQNEAGAIRTGEAAQLQLAQFAGKNFEGRVVRTSSALDPASRTLLAEIQIPNRSGVLMPGMYGQVMLRHPQTNPPLIVPGDTLVIGPKGPQIATVGPDSRVLFKSVVLGRDFGTEVEVLQGLNEGEMVIANPNDQVSNGVQVKPEQGADRQKAKAHA